MALRAPHEAHEGRATNGLLRRPPAWFAWARARPRRMAEASYEATRIMRAAKRFVARLRQVVRLRDLRESPEGLRGPSAGHETIRPAAPRK